jgi:hypothetical protein
VTTKSVEIRIPKIKIERSVLYLIGTTPLIAHAFSEKARKKMLGRQMGEALGGREPRDPYAEVDDSKYILPDGRHGFPAVAFKCAAVTACTSLAGVTKVAARQAFYVEGFQMKSPGAIPDSFVRTALVPLISHPPVIREDVGRLSGPGHTAEMRYRPEYTTWGVELTVLLNPHVVSLANLWSMFQAAGHGVGIGDYRSEKEGDCGLFRMAVNEDEFDRWRRDSGLAENVTGTKKLKKAA